MSGVIVGGLSGRDKALESASSNLVNKGVIGGRRLDFKFLPGIAGAKGGSAPSAVVKEAIADNAVINNMVTTGRELDWAIKGEGAFPVKRDGALGMSTVGSFGYEEKTKILKNAAGDALQVRELVDGKLPENYGSVNSLVDASFRNISSSAQATKNLFIAANLDANGDLIDGPGSIIDYTIAGAATAATRNAIITPGENAQGALYIGDTISLTSSVPGAVVAAAPNKFQFGGFAVSKKITASAPIYVAPDVTTRFNISTQGVASTGPTQLAFGQGLRIIVGGTTYNFTATTNSNQEAQGQFTGLQSLCDSINSVAGGQVIATIGADSRLYIAPKDADSGISFSDISPPGGWPGLVDVLGLDNVAPNSPTQSGFTRYSNDLELSRKINIVSTLSTRFTGKTLRFGASAATSALGVGGGSSKVRTFQRVTSGYQATGGGVVPDSILRRTVSIQSSNHGLKIGDYIRIAGAGSLVGPVGAPVVNALQDGLYRVDFVGDDFFSVATKADLVAVGAGGTFAAPAPAVGTSMMNSIGVANPSCTWQKVDGCFAANNATQLAGRPGAVGDTAITAIGAGGVYTVGITLAAGDASDNITNGDVVYITGSTVLKSGYYRVAGAAGGPPRTGFNVFATAKDLTDTRTAVIGAGASALITASVDVLAMAYADGPSRAAAAAAASTALINGTNVATAIYQALIALPSFQAAIVVGGDVAAALAAAAAPDAAAALAAARAAVPLVYAPAIVGFPGGDYAADIAAIRASIPAVTAGAPAAYIAAYAAHVAAFVGKAFDPPAVADNAFKVTKVSAAIGGDIDTLPVRIYANSANVTVAVPAGNHTYRVGDVIMFRGLSAGGAVYQNIKILPDKAYTVTAVGTNTVTFTADVVNNTLGIDPATGRGGAEANGYIGYNNTWDGAVATAIVAGAVGPVGVPNSTTNLGAGAYIDYIGAEFSAIGISTNAAYFTTALDPTYGGGDPTRNFAAGTAKPSYTISTNVFDTLGIEHPVNISFGNMSSNVVAVEIWLPQNEQGIYDISNPRAAGTGLVAYGNITFDGDGHIIGVDQALQKLNFQWNNGADLTTVVPDWGAVRGVSLIDGKPAKPGLTKLAGPNHAKFIEPDGNAPGSVVGYSYSKSGVITAHFSNGSARDVYQVLIATVANYDGLKNQGGGFYVPNPSESGQLLLQIAGTANAGSFNSGALQGSAINSSSELIGATEYANDAKTLYRAYSIKNEVDAFAINNI
jgi:flagellar hook-basal body protein